VTYSEHYAERKIAKVYADYHNIHRTVYASYEVLCIYPARWIQCSLDVEIPIFLFFLSNMIFEKINFARQSRQISAPLPQELVPYTSSDLFKVQSSENKSSAKCWHHRFSDHALRQVPSMLKTAAAASLPDGTITLGTGRPAAEFYSPTTTREDQDGIQVSSTCSQGEISYDLSLALNYGYAAGSPQLLRFVTEHIEMMHDPLYADWSCSLTCRSTSARDISLRMLCNPCTSVLAEQYTYPGMLDAAKSLGLNVVGVAMDDHGLVPSGLAATLQHWKGTKSNVLYMIPTGHILALLASKSNL
jgi:aromatic amino acid aminotransferase I